MPGRATNSCAAGNLKESDLVESAPTTLVPPRRLDFSSWPLRMSWDLRRFMLMLRLRSWDWRCDSFEVVDFLREAIMLSDCSEVFGRVYSIEAPMYIYSEVSRPLPIKNS